MNQPQQNHSHRSQSQRSQSQRSHSQCSHSQRYDIAIIGGGMVGASLAAMLNWKNSAWRIALIDNNPLPQAGVEPQFHPSFAARSTALGSGSRDIFEAIDLWKTLSRHVTPIKKVHVSDRGFFAGNVIERDQFDQDAVGYVIQNQWLGQVLLHHLQVHSDVSLLAASVVKSMRPKADGYHLDIVDQDNAQMEVFAGLAIIADGASSPLRQQLGISVSEFDYNQHAVIANIGLKKPHQGVAYERFTDTGAVALLPLSDSQFASHAEENIHRSALVWTHPSSNAEAILSLDDKAFLQHLQQRFGWRAGELMAVGKRDSYPLQRIISREQVRQNLVVMGNAAHFLHPVAGQGFNLALRDCAELTENLGLAVTKGDRIGDLNVLQRYQAQQSYDQWLTTEASHWLTQLFSNRHCGAALLRQTGLLLFNQLAPLQTVFAQQAMGRLHRHLDLKPIVVAQG